MYLEINREATSEMLEDNGVPKGITQAKIDGTYTRPPHLTNEFMLGAREDYVVEYIKKFLDTYPLMFEKDKDLRDKFLRDFKGARIKFRKYPEIIHAMYNGNLDQIPEDLKTEENTHKSVLIDEINEHFSRRESQSM